MIPLTERQSIIDLFREAIAAGARRDKAAQELDFPTRTLRRWLDAAGEVHADRRPQAVRPAPVNRLTQEERQAVLALCNAPEYASLPPSQIVPRLADQGVYVASESTFYRVLKSEGQLHARGRARAAAKPAAPATHIATGPNQVWSWDISYMPSRVRGRYWYLYAVMDVYSRKLVAWEVHEAESGEAASVLIERAVLREGCYRKPLVLHADNGGPMKASTLRAKLEELGITASHSRPRVSNDNPYSESLFRTLKYCPQWPSQGFGTLEEARCWMLEFDRFYNHDHRHSRLRFVTPAQRHNGEDKALLAGRKAVYEAALKEKPERWSQKRTRNWTPVGAVALNPEKDNPGCQKAA